ncbi:hypothetical protein BDD12DRAFT_907032 [Trichophaea hybrida]|nr:hypothetical protein BDD12DRAFT_907032 [Trichophaea hybrida]
MSSTRHYIWALLLPVDSGVSSLISSQDSLKIGVEAADMVGLTRARIFVFDDELLLGNVRVEAVWTDRSRLRGGRRKKYGVRHWSALMSPSDNFQWKAFRTEEKTHQTAATNYSSGSSTLKTELPANQPGKLHVRALNVCKGYYNNPKATAGILSPDGWLKTDDIAHYSPQEKFYIVDRKKELIKVKGNQVAPAELESMLLENPKIADAAVIGIPHSGSE